MNYISYGAATNIEEARLQGKDPELRDTYELCHELKSICELYVKQQERTFANLDVLAALELVKLDWKEEYL